MASTVLQACDFLTATTLSMPVQRSKEVLSLLSAADQQAMASPNVYQSLDYANSAYYAKDAYSKSLRRLNRSRFLLNNKPQRLTTKPTDQITCSAMILIPADDTEDLHHEDRNRILFIGTRVSRSVSGRSELDAFETPRGQIVGADPELIDTLAEVMSETFVRGKFK